MSEQTSESQATGLKTQSGGELSTGNVLSQEYQELLNGIWQNIGANADASDYTVSRVAILQPQSPEVAGNVAGYQSGMLIDNLTRMQLSFDMKPPWLIGKVPEDQLTARQVMYYLPVLRLPDEYIDWIPKTEQQAGQDPWRFKTLDKGDERVRAGCWPPIGTWQGEGSPPVTRNMNFIGVALDPATKLGLTNFIVLTFSRTSFSSGKRFFSLLDGHRMRRLAPWDVLYFVETERKHNQAANAYYYVMNVHQGPVLRDRQGNYNTELIDPEMILMAQQMGTWLDSDKANQEAMINAAGFGEEDHQESAAPSGDASAPPPDDDPFAAPPEEEAQSEDEGF